MRIALSLLLVLVATTTHAQQDSYTLLLMEFENRSGIDNPLLTRFNDTMSFVLSRQAEGVQVRVIPSVDRDTLLTRAASMQSDKTAMDQALLAAELADVDALVTGSYTKQGDIWSLDAQVYHRREGSKARQQIAIQEEGVYRLLDAFPAQLLPQFSGAGTVAITTDSWKAYEAFRKGHEQFEGYNFFGALDYYNQAIALDPTLALAYAEQSYVYFMTGQGDQAVAAVQNAQQHLSDVSVTERRAIEALAFCWDVDLRALTYESAPNFLTSGGIYDEEWVCWILGNAHQASGRMDEASNEYERWFEAAARKLQWKQNDPDYTLLVIAKCAGAHVRLDTATEYGERLLEEHGLRGNNHLANLLIYLYGQQGQVSQAFKLYVAHRSPGQDAEQSPNLRLPFNEFGVDNAQDALAQIVVENHVPPAQVREWCQGLLDAGSREAHCLLAWAYAHAGDLGAAQASFAEVGVPWEQDWWVVGLFDGVIHGIESTLPPEVTINMDQIYDGGTGPVQWQPADDGYMNGVLQLTQILDFRMEQASHVHAFPRALPGRGFEKHRVKHYWIAYAIIYIDVSESRDARLHLKTSQESLWTMWLNNTTTLYSGPITPGRTLDTKISVRAGLNKVLIKLIQHENMGLYLRFRITDLDGNAIPGLKYVSLKDVLVSQ